MVSSAVKIPFSQWCRAAESELRKTFGIDFQDAGLSPEQLESHARFLQDPSEFVLWFARKYDLTSRQQFDAWF